MLSEYKWIWQNFSAQTLSYVFLLFLFHRAILGKIRSFRFRFLLIQEQKSF